MIVDLMISRNKYSPNLKEMFTEVDYESEELFREKIRQITHYKEEILTEEQIQKLREKFGC